MTEKMNDIPSEPKWVWLGLAACCYMTFLFGGTVKCMGLFYVEYLELFAKGEVATSGVQTAMTIANCAVTPIAGIMADRLPIRQAMLIVAFLGSVGHLIASFAPNLALVILGQGIMFGIAGALQVPCSVSTVTRMFNRHRSFANGLMLASASVGTIALPPVLGNLIEIYTVRGALFVVAGLCLNTLAVSLVLDPKRVAHAQRLSRFAGIDTQVEEKRVRTEKIKIISDGKLDSDNQVEDKDVISAITSSAVCSISEALPPTTMSEGPTLDTDRRYTTANSGRYECSVKKLELGCISENESLQKQTSDIQEGTVNRLSRLSVLQENRNKLNVQPKSLKPPASTLCFTLFRPFAKILCNKAYLVYLLGRTASFIAHLTSIYLLPAYAAEMNVPLQLRALLISLMGGCELIARVGLGYIGDIRGVSKPLLVATQLLTCGCITMVLASLHGAIFVYMIAVVQGLLASSIMLFTGPIVADIVDFQYIGSAITVAFASGYLGVGALQIPLEYFRAVSGSYSHCFQVLASFYLLGGATILVLFFVTRECQCVRNIEYDFGGKATGKKEDCSSYSGRFTALLL